MSKIKSKIKNNKSKLNQEKADMSEAIMEKVKKGEIKMKSKWIFVLGSLVTMLSIVGLTIGAVFLTNLTIFLIRKRGLGYGRLYMMLNSFPLCIPLLAVLGIILGIWLLKKYDFSYKKNFLLIIIGFIVSVIIAGFIIDSIGLNDIWSRRGPMRGFYKQINTQEIILPRGKVRGRMYKN
jgi:hypothetical protein